MAGKPVLLKKGTVVQVATWPRHRNPELWGADVDQFKPHRDFSADELMHVGCPAAAKNPQSSRFSPFAHNPRSCLGRNFAQMEMRLIVLYLVRDYGFALAPPYDKLAGDATPNASFAETGQFRGVNLATMGPMDMEGGFPTKWGGFPNYGMKLKIIKRPASSSNL